MKALSLVSSCLVLSLALGLVAHGHAQERARRLVAPGEVTGLEMTIEGALHASPGGHVRWLVTTYEVLRRRDLRVAAGIQLAVTASFAEGPALATTTSDASGHALLELALPPDLDGGFQISVEAISPRGIRRVFDAPIELDAARRVQLVLDRESAPPGGSVLAMGRVIEARDGRPSVSAHVTIELRSGAVVRAPIDLVTDASGVFVSEVVLPTVGAYVVTATSDDGSASVNVDAHDDVHAILWARAETARPVVHPGESVAVDVLVRAEDGTPVEGARVEWDDVPPPDDDALVVRSNASGHATLSWEIDRYAAPDDGFEDRSRTIRIVHAAHGTGAATASVRVARSSSFVTWSVEGGALAVGISSRVFVRVTAPDGSPRAGVAIAMEQGALGAARSARTDADGVAVLDVTLAAAHDDASGCGGPTAVPASLTIDGDAYEACLPVEPDALLGVRAIAHGTTLDVSLSRRPEANDHPIAIVALVRTASGWDPVARVVTGPRDASATLTLPTLDVAPIWVRARVILDGQEVVGGGTVLFASMPSPIGSLSATDHDAHLDGARLLFSIEAPLAASFESRFASLTTPIGLAVASGRTELFVAGLAASSVPRDTAAPAVLREGVVSPLSLPDDAVSQGLLRDPWRTRARFVRGRLGAMMRAVETLVDARVPNQIDRVGVQENGAWRFDREMLEAALVEAGLGDERAAALDGEPLDIASLTTMDPSFTYDHVARRITRERLFRNLWLLRQLVRERQLDLAWARRGDPTEYLVSLLESDVSFDDEYPTRELLFDAWGHPFVLAPVHGHARFELLQPVPGYELVSGGPDGRVGTSDDVFDPFARVLTSGSVYAEAVQEDELVARLGSVELGRATVETLAEAFSYTPNVDYDVSEISATISWGSEPSLLSDVPTPLAEISSVVRARFGIGTASSWTMLDALRPYVAVGLAFGASGDVALRTAPFEAGAPFVAHVETPPLVRVGDALRLPIRFVQLTRGEAPTPTAEARVEGAALQARVEGSDLVLEALQPGITELSLVVHASGTADSVITTSIRSLPVGALHAAHTGAMGTGAIDLDLRVPDGSRPWRARWVIGAPAALRRDPLFAESGHDAALSAWADALAGATPSAADMAALESTVSAAPSGLHTACALVAWAVAGDPQHTPAFANASRNLASTVPGDLRARAAMLAALAPAAPSMGDTSSSLSAVVAMLREDAWRALATERDHPTTLAEMAAALLLVDRDDAVARALFERARAAATEHGFPVDTADGLAGTFALVIAARQIDRDALADALADVALSHLHLAPRLSVETRFWALAASGFGALGGEPVSTVTLEVDGAARELTLLDGAVVLDDVRPGAHVRVRASSRVWARGEVRAVAPYADRAEVAVDARIEGEVGSLGERTALELVIESTGDEELTTPVVEIAIPSGAILDASARSSIAGAAAVSSVEGPDGAGVLRISLSALRARGTYRIPLPLRWRASGHTHGLGVVVYDRSSPWIMTTRSERTLEVTAP